MNSYKRYDQETIKSIEVGLTQYNSASKLAKVLNIDVSGLIKHIKKHRCLKESSSRNKCGIKNSCHIVGFCEKKPCMKYRIDPKESNIVLRLIAINLNSQLEKSIIFVINNTS